MCLDRRCADAAPSAEGNRGQNELIEQALRCRGGEAV